MVRNRAPIKIVCQLAFIALLTIACDSSEAQRPRCSYGNDVFSEMSFRVSRASCQFCYHGRWETAETLTPSESTGCLASDAPLGADIAFEAGLNVCSAEEAGLFSDGAVRMAGGKCWQCEQATWIEADAVLACGAARSIAEQRAIKSPVLPPELEAHVPTRVGFKIIYSLVRGEFAAVEGMIDASYRNRERLKDGLWSLDKLFNEYDDALRRTEIWDQQLSLIRQWRAASPRSAAAALIEARYWLAYARFAAGDGISSDVPPAAQQNADQRTAAARSVLEASKSHAAKNPVWYSEMLTVATLQRWPYRRKALLFDEALKKDPGFEPTYTAMATSLAPRSGGSLEEYHRFVDAAVKRTRKFDGDSMYARLYWNLSHLEPHKGPFSDLGIPWPQMKAGFESLLERYPDSEWNLQNFASFACQAEDARTFVSLLPRLSDAAASRARRAWKGAYSLEYCRGRYTRKA